MLQIYFRSLYLSIAGDGNKKEGCRYFVGKNNNSRNEAQRNGGLFRPVRAVMPCHFRANFGKLPTVYAMRFFVAIRGIS